VIYDKYGNVMPVVQNFGRGDATANAREPNIFSATPLGWQSKLPEKNF